MSAKNETYCSLPVGAFILQAINRYLQTSNGGPLGKEFLQIAKAHHKVYSIWTVFCVIIVSNEDKAFVMIL